MTSYVHCGLYDPERSTDALRQATAEAVDHAGLALAEIVPLPAARGGGLVDLRIDQGRLTPDLFRPFGALGARLASVILEANPAVAIVGTAAPQASLDGLAWDVGRTVLGVGWVRLDCLDDRQAEAFRDLQRQRLVRRLGNGLTWGPGQLWSLTREFLRQPERLTAAVFEALTGQQAGPVEPPGAPEPGAPEPGAWEPVAAEQPDPESNPEWGVPEEVDQDELNALNSPELWFWHHELDEDTLAERVQAALPTYDVSYPEWEEPRWRPVIAVPPEALEDQASLLDDLRRAAVAVESDWAALQPRGGHLVPGADMDVPAAGILDHPWVSHAWAGDRIAGIRRALEGATVEEVGAGVLFVTARDPRDAGAAPVTRWTTTEERFAAVTEAARILGEVARDSVDGPSEPDW